MGAQRQRAGQARRLNAIQVDQTGDTMIGRPLMVRVEVRRPGGAHMVRAVVIELTGGSSRPFLVRARAR